MDFITSGPLVAMVLEGHEAIVAARQVIGATDPLEAATGSIRGDFALQTGENMVHGSDSPDSAARETALFFRTSPSPLAGRRPRPGLGLAPAAGDPGTRRHPLHRPRPRAGELRQGEAVGLTLANALAKARAVQRPRERETVLGCDTVVTLDGTVYGKPADREQAELTLRTLAGRTHEVVSGLAGAGRGASPPAPRPHPRQLPRALRCDGGLVRRAG